MRITKKLFVSGLLLFWIIGLAGCQSTEPAEGSPLAKGFQVRKVHLQPSFTRWQLSETPGGSGRIEATVELTDQFGDPIKSLGEFRFELFRYQPAISDPRGRRMETNGTQVFHVAEVTENQQAWDRITRSYRFLLKTPDNIAVDNSRLVLQVTFSQDEYHLQDMLILNREKPEPR